MVSIHHLLAHHPTLHKDCAVELNPDIKTADFVVRPVSVAAGTEGLYLHPPSNLRLQDLVHSYTLFALYTSAPYVRKRVVFEHAELKSLAAGEGYGMSSFITALSELYAAEYKGPFTVGVQCTAPAQASSSLP